MIRFNVLTLFPDLITTYCSETILGRAQQEKLIEVATWNIRDFSTDKHKTVDDTPYGGGAGMVMKVEPIDRTLHHLGHKAGTAGKRIIVLSAGGRQFTQTVAQEYSQLDELTLICGRYEGIDQRVADHLAEEELSIGPYVLAGGELAALIVLEAVARLIPGILGNPESLLEESFASSPPTPSLPAGQAGLRRTLASQVEYPQYTKPADYKGWKVPDVLLSGDHQAIKKWRLSAKPPTDYTAKY